MTAVETLHGEGQRGVPRAMAVPVHPHVTGHPHRAPFLDEALAHMEGLEGVWFATGSELVDRFLELRE